MSRSQNFLEEGEEEAIHHNVLPLNKKQFIVQNFMFLGSYHKLYMTLLFRISFRKKRKRKQLGRGGKGYLWVVSDDFCVIVTPNIGKDEYWFRNKSCITT